MHLPRTALSKRCTDQEPKRPIAPQVRVSPTLLQETTSSRPRGRSPPLPETSDGSGRSSIGMPNRNARRPEHPLARELEMPGVSHPLRNGLLNRKARNKSPCGASIIEVVLESPAVTARRAGRRAWGCGHKCCDNSRLCALLAARFRFRSMPVGAHIAGPRIVECGSSESIAYHSVRIPSGSLISCSARSPGMGITPGPRSISTFFGRFEQHG
jgi:hypothetical protein